MDALNGFIFKNSSVLQPHANIMFLNKILKAQCLVPTHLAAVLEMIRTRLYAHSLWTFTEVCATTYNYGIIHNDLPEAVIIKIC